MESWTKNNILFQIIHEDEAEKIADFMIEFYFPYEPTVIGTDYFIDDVLRKRFVEYLKGVLKQHLSLKAVDPETQELLGNILSVKSGTDDILNYLRDEDNLPEKNKENIRKMRHNFRFVFDVVCNKDGLEDRYPKNADEVLEFLFLTTNANIRKKGVGTALYEESLAFARRYNLFTYINVCAVNIFARRIGEKFGFEVLREVQYEGAIVDGIPAMTKDTGVHNSGVFMLKKL